MSLFYYITHGSIRYHKSCADERTANDIGDPMHTRHKSAYNHKGNKRGYRDHYAPSEYLVLDTGTYLHHCRRHHEDLEKSFSDEQKGTFEKFHDCWSEYMSLAEKAIFVYAFKLGGRLMLETLSEQRKN